MMKEVAEHNAKHIKKI